MKRPLYYICGRSEPHTIGWDHELVISHPLLHRAYCTCLFGNAFRMAKHGISCSGYLPKMDCNITEHLTLYKRWHTTITNTGRLPKKSGMLPQIATATQFSVTKLLHAELLWAELLSELLLCELLSATLCSTLLWANVGSLFTFLF